MRLALITFIFLLGCKERPVSQANATAPHHLGKCSEIHTQRDRAFHHFTIFTCDFGGDICYVSVKGQGLGIDCDFGGRVAR